jgi:hypothetical protein
MSTPSLFTSTGIWPTVATASVWNTICLSFAILEISSIGWIVPTSLLACMTEIMMVPG